MPDLGRHQFMEQFKAGADFLLMLMKHNVPCGDVSFESEEIGTDKVSGDK
jgi:hypothetical protein